MCVPGDTRSEDVRVRHRPSATLRYFPRSNNGCPRVRADRTQDWSIPRCYIQEFNSWDGVAPAWRGAAINAWNSGADGLYIFNGFHAYSVIRRHSRPDPYFLALRAIISATVKPGEP